MLRGVLIHLQHRNCAEPSALGAPLTVNSQLIAEVRAAAAQVLMQVCVVGSSPRVQQPAYEALEVRHHCAMWGPGWALFPGWLSASPSVDGP